MAYISKKDILAAYKKLSEMHPDPNAQGATQKVSAIRHFLALDRFYKLHNRDCNTRDKSDKDEFCKLVGIVSDVCLDLYTTNFYYPLKQHNGDFSVGSNFYSAGQVSASLVNPQGVFDYPKRGGTPLLKIQNGVLQRDVAYYENLKNYISSTEYSVALVVWMLRKIYVEQDNDLTVYQNVYNALSQLFSNELISVLFDDQEEFESLLEEYDLTFNDNFYSIKDDDIKSLFNSMTITSLIENDSRQIIFYGAPGTGKSYKVKKKAKNHNSIRTTFHPDSDYSTFVGAYKPTMDKKPLYGLFGDKTIRYNDGGNLSEPTISYKFIPQAFLKAYCEAWRRWSKGNEEPYYLVIEEINRGNCAQIFGDLFQLLDRDQQTGYSTYAIEADDDIRRFISEDENGRLLEKEGSVINDVKDKDGDTIATGEEIVKGEKLVLPPNLYIWATMNTSDQSLFPIDSAFKRRWDWEYVPIKYNNEHWEIVLDEENKYKWTDFQHKVNDMLKGVATGEDKMLGDFFVIADEKNEISAKLLLNKILFYLWSDVCKDGEGEIFRLRTSEGDQKTTEVKFAELFLPTGEPDIEKLKQLMAALEVKPIGQSDNSETEQ